jgi:hypothetical protein
VHAPGAPIIRESDGTQAADAIHHRPQPRRNGGFVDKRQAVTALRFGEVGGHQSRRLRDYDAR